MPEVPGRIVIDTNVWIYHIKGIPSAGLFLAKIGEAARRNRVDILYSTITKAELFSCPGLSGIERARIERLLKLGEAIDVDPSIARKAAEIRAALGHAGQKVPNLPNALIAATALQAEAAVASRNRPDFGRVEGLTLLDPIVRAEVIASGLP